MIFDECHFEFGNFTSKQYGLIFAHVDTSPINVVAGSIESITIYNKGTQSMHLVGSDYSGSTLNLDAEIITYDGVPLSQREKRIVEKSLFNHPEYRRLYIDIEDDYLCSSYELINGKIKRSYLNCRFINPEKIESQSGEIVGYKFTIECDSSMLWQDAIESVHTLNHSSADTDSVLTVNVDTDMNEYIYPKVTITMGSVGGNITISNNTDSSSRLTSFIGLSPYITLVLKGGGVNYVSGDNYIKFSNKNFIRLLDGTNYISVTGNVSEIKFEFQNRRYL